MIKELYFKAHGLVQGIGYRYYASRVARRFGLFGFCRNIGKDGFECVVQGEKNKTEQFLEQIKKGPDSARPEKIEFEFRKPNENFTDFSVQ